MSYQARILDLSGDDSSQRISIQGLDDGVPITRLHVVVRQRQIIPVETATPELTSRKLLSVLNLESASKEIPRLPETDIPEVELALVPREKAIDLIKSYIDSHRGCRTGDIIYDLALDPDLVLDVLGELEERGKIRGENIE